MANLCIVCYESGSFLLATHEALRAVGPHKINDNLLSLIIEPFLDNSVNCITDISKFGETLLSYFKFLELDADVTNIMHKGRQAIKIHIAGYRHILFNTENGFLQIGFVSADDEEQFEDEEAEDYEQAPNEL